MTEVFEKDQEFDPCAALLSARTTLEAIEVAQWLIEDAQSHGKGLNILDLARPKALETVRMLEKASGVRSE